jgi:hypothetical protein
VDVVLLTGKPEGVDFRLQTPNGLLIEPWRARLEPSMRFEMGDGVAYYRLALPAQLRPGRFDRSGTWHVLLTPGRPRLDRQNDNDEGVDLSILRGRPGPSDRPLPRRRPFEGERAFAVHQAQVGESALGAAVAGAEPPRGRVGLPYNVVVHAYSSITLRARVNQQSFEPGAEVLLHAVLWQSGLPVGGEPAVWADITGPDGTNWTQALDPDGLGQFGTGFVASIPGLYRARIRARGRTRAGRPFVREATVTAAAFSGADKPPPSGGGGHDDSICNLLACLLKPGGMIDDRLERRLRESGIDLDHARRCLRSCRDQVADE